jgi:hypothetical protein
MIRLLLSPGNTDLILRLMSLHERMFAAFLLVVSAQRRKKPQENELKFRLPDADFYRTTGQVCQGVIRKIGLRIILRKGMY